MCKSGRLRLFFGVIFTLISFSSFAQTFFGANKPAQPAGSTNQSVSPQDFKALVKSLGQQNQQAISQHAATLINKPAAPASASAPSAPPPISTLAPTAIQPVSGTPATAAAPPAAAPSSPPTTVTTQTTTSMPSSSPSSVYTGFGGSKDQSTTTTTTTSPSKKESEWKIQY